jgi:parvulin-like peptidyl-prolyl isomerase
VRQTVASLLLAALATAAAAAPPAELPAEPNERDKPSAVFATVGEAVITGGEFQASLQSSIRQRYFHGQAPTADLVALRHEVMQTLIDRVLLAREAQRRGIKPEASWVDTQLKQLEARLQSDPRRADLLADARGQLNDDSAIYQLKQQVEAIPEPDARAVQEYYRSHPDKFTTPERVRVSMILLKVEPWAPGASWEAAEGEAAQLREQLQQGADFAALARLHSADPSAERGGDLGYIHRGMFSDETQGVIDGLAPGALSAPVRLLQGFALFRLDERVAPRLNEFAQAEARARALLRREQAAAAWEGMRAGLRDNVKIEINEAALSASD